MLPLSGPCITLKAHAKSRPPSANTVAGSSMGPSPYPLTLPFSRLHPPSLPLVSSSITPSLSSLPRAASTPSLLVVPLVGPCTQPYPLLISIPLSAPVPSLLEHQPATRKLEHQPATRKLERNRDLDSPVLDRPAPVFSPSAFALCSLLPPFARFSSSSPSHIPFACLAIALRHRRSCRRPDSRRRHGHLNPLLIPPTSTARRPVYDLKPYVTTRSYDP